MFIYADKVENYQLGMFTNSERRAKELRFNIKLDENDIEEAYDKRFYIKGHAPKKPEPTKAEIEQARASRYTAEVDPMTAEINRLRDEEQTPEVVARIDELMILRKDTVAKIKADLPYAEEKIVA